jgi:CTP:molybdopterin cytidylyltransferase MocA
MSSCVIAAAGASSRMGQWKPLLPFAGSTVIQATVGAARAADLPVILVVGHRGEELAALFAGEPLVKVLLNPDWEDGQLGSVLLGVAAAEAPTVFLMNGDMPLVRPSPTAFWGEEWARRSAEGFARSAAVRGLRRQDGAPGLISGTPPSAPGPAGCQASAGRRPANEGSSAHPVPWAGGMLRTRESSWTSIPRRLSADCRFRRRPIG